MREVAGQPATLARKDVVSAARISRLDEVNVLEQPFKSKLNTVTFQPWDLGSMASQCGLGRSRFGHYCEELTNLSPNRFLAHCRLQAAAKLLSHSPDRTVTDVAFDCGFESSQYFANMFRREFGCTPSDYRKQHGSDEIKKR